MPMGIFQNNSLLHLTLDTWYDEVFFNGVSYPAGYFAAQVLNMEGGQLCRRRPRLFQQPGLLGGDGGLATGGP